MYYFFIKKIHCPLFLFVSVYRLTLSQIIVKLESPLDLYFFIFKQISRISSTQKQTPENIIFYN